VRTIYSRRLFSEANKKKPNENKNILKIIIIPPFPGFFAIKRTRQPNTQKGIPKK